MCCCMKKQLPHQIAYEDDDSKGERGEGQEELRQSRGLSRALGAGVQQTGECEQEREGRH